MGLLDGLGGAIGPILAIVVIYVVYRAFMDMETAQEVKKTSVEVSKIDAETRREQVRLEREKLFTQFSEKQLPIKDVDSEYKILEDKKDEEVN